ncbi:NUDIX hydrolase [Dyadobacter tibetensis]|uniref:NUDIX hydrolase n=1 Tax=Dyadobacter tibetensis TaxID=1211851 RepID=UPI000471A3B6|nr:NUDIX hydrolase [Dyadobacter tibetensis]
MSSLLKYLNAYTPIDDNEKKMLEATLTLVTENSECFLRSNLEGHITASAWIVDPRRSQALLMHHRKLNRWFQPGGHCDGDKEVLAVARKEAEEETGLAGLTLIFDQIFDIDRHTIPANARDAAHDHFDIRFLFEADPQTPLLINEESRALKWIPLSEIKAYNDSESILRMVRKTRALQSLLPVAGS